MADLEATSCTFENKISPALMFAVPWAGQSMQTICPSEVKVRKNCGFPGISGECQSRGCCFDSSIRGVIFCFFPANMLEEDCLPEIFPY
uniref:P-type domain-containing protein n=1 Tax=Salvator merianae TaxID=96440 RepID=A0A8D0EBV3_SALMN